MNSSTLKWIAIITMTIDHIGLYLIDPVVHETLFYIFRGVGRIAFPLFAFFIAEGFKHTSNLKNYFTRLLMIALGIEISLLVFYLFTNENYIIVANVFWPLVFGLLAVMLVSTRKLIYTFLGFSLVVVADIIGFPYGGYGVFMILIFAFIPDFKKQVLYTSIIHLFYIAYPFAFLFPYVTKYDNPLQWLGMISFAFIYFYNGERGKMNKLFFYIYYPVHIVLIVGLSYFI